MNPKMTEGLAQDRIAALRNEALGQQILARAAATRQPASEVPSTRHATAFARAWRRLRAARLAGPAAWSRPRRSP